MDQKIKVTTYCDPKLWKAVKRFATEKEVPVTLVVEQLIKKQIPAKYFEEA
jgi:hypothetical protein